MSTSEWRISNSSIVKILTTIALVFVVVKIAPLLVLLAMALMLACTFYPAIRFLEKKLPHWAAASIISFLVIASLVALVAIVVPAIVSQITALTQKFPEIQSGLMEKVGKGAAGKFLHRILDTPLPAGHMVTAGQYVVDGVSALVLTVVMGLYFAADGERTYKWIQAFFSPTHRKKLDASAEALREIIVAYVVGQVITSVLCAIFVFIILQVLSVPGALVLAVLAAIFDILPMIGFFIFTIPAVLLAWTVSSQTALIVAASYLAYHLIENYFIVPKIYGNRLRLSDLVVLVAVLAGAYLGGIMGAILSLPLVAAYPSLERIWLVPYVGREVVQKHKA